jgi:uncharacterized protein (TIGR03437 family)
MSLNRNLTYRAVCVAAILVVIPHAALAQTRPQIGGGTCTTSIVTGTYFYLVGGEVASSGGGTVYAELGKLVADGNGNVSGQSYASVGGQQTTYSLSGTYTVQANCAGTITVTNGQTTNNLAFQVTNNGQGMIVAIFTSSAVVGGSAYRQTASATPIQCGNGSLSGAYGYRLSGVAPVSGGVAYSDAGQFVADGNGNATGASVANFGGSVSQTNANGSYSVASDCSGVAQVTNQNGTLNYRFALVQDGQAALFFESDPGWTTSGIFTPQFAAPSQSIVNGASFKPGVAPGSLFSIFGTGFAVQPASAGSLPLSETLGSTQVLVNGTPAPLVYVSPTQINAQMPVGTPTGQPVTLTVTNGAPSNNVTVTIPPTSPGIFTSNGTQGIIQNSNGSLNSTNTLAHVGDVLVAYLTGGGAVNTTGSWTSGAASPGGASSVAAPYSVTVGGQPAQVEYVGLTPGFVGLYQTNFTVPSLAPGAYPVVVTIGGVSSNAAMVDVGG